jgi:hypothetical protein
MQREHARRRRPGHGGLGRERVGRLDRCIGAPLEAAVASGAFSTARHLYEESLGLFHRVSDTRGVAEALTNLGEAAGRCSKRRACGTGTWSRCARVPSFSRTSCSRKQQRRPFQGRRREPGVSIQSSNGRSRGDSATLLPYGGSNVYPIPVAPLATRHRLSREHWTELVEHSKNESLRQLARRYGLSHEAVRGALKAATFLCS